MEPAVPSRVPLHTRRLAAARLDTSPHLLEMLAGDPDADVRLAVARHPSTPLTSLQRLAGDTVVRVAVLARVRAAAHRVVGDVAS